MSGKFNPAWWLDPNNNINISGSLSSLSSSSQTTYESRSNRGIFYKSIPPFSAIIHAAIMTDRKRGN